MLVEQWKDQMTGVQTVTENALKGVADVWSSNFSQLRRSGEDFSDWFKKSWLDMADYAIGQIQKMAMNYALWGNVSGETGGTSFFGTSSSGYGGILGGILSLFKLQEGGQFWVNRRTLLEVGEGGEREFVSVVPESKMAGKGSGDVYVIQNYVQVTDPGTFVRTYGNLVKKLSADTIAEAKRYNLVYGR